MINWVHLKAILWLRWRLSVNQWRKHGGLNLAIMMIAVFSLLTFAVISLFASIALGVTLLPRFESIHLMYLWDVMVGILLCSWLLSLLTEIQRMELLSLDKLLHLPLSLRDAFMLNYASSIVSLNIICFLPIAIGLSLASAYTHGLQMLLLIPLTLAFLLMVTAVTYQFRGWLASLMTNQRRKRTVITIMTLGIIGVAQVPNLVMQVTMPAFRKAKQEQFAELTNAKNGLSKQLAEQAITQEAYELQLSELEESWKEKRKQQEEARDAMLSQYAVLTNQILPIGWLPMSTKLLADRSFLAGLCFLGMSGIGLVSLHRSYGATLRAYTGDVRGKRAKGKGANEGRAVALSPQADQASLAPEKGVVPKRRLLVASTIPGLSDQSSGMILSNFMNLIRAPEVKMVLVGPVIMIGLLLVFIMTGRIPMIAPQYAQLAWMGGIGGVLFFGLTINLNIFGMDRDGFRAYVLMPIERRRILVGKNLSTLPLLLGIAGMFAICLYCLASIGPLDFLAMVVQLGCGLFFASLLGNWVSILFPMALSPGTGKPVHVNLVTILVQLGVIMLMPCFLLPGFAFIALDWALKTQMGITAVPVFLILSLVELGCTWLIYSVLIQYQGTLLQSRETKILETLTRHSE